MGVEFCLTKVPKCTPLHQNCSSKLFGVCDASSGVLTLYGAEKKARENAYWMTLRCNRAAVITLWTFAADNNLLIRTACVSPFTGNKTPKINENTIPRRPMNNSSTDQLLYGTKTERRMLYFDSPIVKTAFQLR